MPPDKNWPRWIFASFTKHFDSKKQGIKMFVEGSDYDTASESNYFEFRANGPYMWEKSKDWWEFQVTINILVVHKRNEKSIHTLYNTIGVVAAAFEKGIGMFRFGDGDDDDSVKFGCMQLCTDKDNAIQIDHLGPVNADVKEMQAMVQATYYMQLEV